MSCEKTAVRYFPGNNKPIKVTIKNEDGTRVTNIQTNTQEIIFQAKDDTGVVVMDLRYTGGKISLAVEQDSSGVDQDVATVSPLPADTNIAPGTYDLWMELTMGPPTEISNVFMFDENGSPLTKLIILEGGVTP